MEKSAFNWLFLNLWAKQTAMWQENWKCLDGMAGRIENETIALKL